MPSNEFEGSAFGLREGCLYETIATTHFIDPETKNASPNAACMGIRLKDVEQLELNPYPNTTTFKNVKQNGKVIINFVDDVYLYALAALKEDKPEFRLKEFPSKYYEYEKTESSEGEIPHIGSAWGYLECKAVQERPEIKESNLGKVEVTTFSLEIINSRILRDSRNLVNRADNVALETIILATRIKVAWENRDVHALIRFIQRLEQQVKDVERFARNPRALKAIQVMKDYITDLGLRVFT